MKNRLPLAFVSLAALSAAAPAFAQTAEQKATLEQARKLHRDEKYLEAASLLTPLAEAFAKDANFHALYGANFWNLALMETPGSAAYTQRLQDAEKAFGRVLALTPNNAGILSLRGQCRLRLERFADAETDFLAASRINPGDEAVTINAADAQVQQGKWLQAHRSYAFAEALLRQKGGPARAIAFVLTRRSAVSVRLSQEPNASSSEAHRALAEALCAMKADPDFAAAKLAVGDAWYALGNLEQATNKLLEAKLLDPKAARTYTSEGAAKNAAGKMPIDMENTVSASKEFDAGRAAFSEGLRSKDPATRAASLTKAIQSYTRVLELHPVELAAWSNRGHTQALLAGDETDISTASADTATALSLIAAFPRTEDARKSLLEQHRDTCIAAQDWAGAAAACELSLKEFPKDSEDASRLLPSCRALIGLSPLDAASKVLELAGGLYKDEFWTKAGRRYVLAEEKARPKSARTLVLRGLLEEAQGSYASPPKSVLKIYSDAIALDPQLAEAYARRGVARSKRYTDGDYVPGSETDDLKKAISLGWSGPEALFVLAKRSKPAEALPYLDTLVKADGENLDYRKMRAEKLGALKDPRALADFGAILRLAPEPENYALRGDYSLAQGKLDEALTDYERALMLDFSEVNYRLARAQVKRMKGDIAGAKKDYDDAHQQDKTIPAVKADLSDAEAADKMRNDARRSLDRAIEAMRRIDTNLPPDYVKKAEALMKEKQVGGAIMMCTKAIHAGSRGQKYVPAYALRGEILLAIRRPDMAVLDFNKQVLLDPKSAQAFLSRANASALLRNYDEAIRDYDRALILDPKLMEAERNREIAKQRKTAGG